MLPLLLLLLLSGGILVDVDVVGVAVVVVYYKIVLYFLPSFQWLIVVQSLATVDAVAVAVENES